MRFVRTDDLEKGMRLAKPIYNRNGVLLYDRDTKLTKQGINSIKNFNLLGIYILEPVEPLPPMTEDSIEFEKFQTMSVFGLKEDLNLLLYDKIPENLDKLVEIIVEKYGRKDKNLYFSQSLRSTEDFVYKHAIYVAILAAMMSAKLGYGHEEIFNMVKAALIHDMGKLRIPSEILEKKEFSKEDNQEIERCESRGLNMLKASFYISEDIKTIVEYKYHLEKDDKFQIKSEKSYNMAQILYVADKYDELTSVNFGIDPNSEVYAVRYLLNPQNEFVLEYVAALFASIKILYPGICVELTNGYKGLVIKGNDVNALKPIVLCFNDNQIYNLDIDRVYRNIQIKDIMKTLDARIKIDRATIMEYLKKYAGKL